jgi:hypothetical protein
MRCRLINSGSSLFTYPLIVGKQMLKRFMILFLGGAMCLGTIGCGESKTATMPENASKAPKEKPKQMQMKPPNPPPRNK